MVWNFNSSDSEEERHDKFRCERTTVPSKESNIKVSVNSALTSSDRVRGNIRSFRNSPERQGRLERRQRQSPTREFNSRLNDVKDGPYDRHSWRKSPDPPARICAQCDYKIDSCRCAKRSNRTSPKEDPKTHERRRNKCESLDSHQRKERLTTEPYWQTENSERLKRQSPEEKNCPRKRRNSNDEYVKSVKRRSEEKYEKKDKERNSSSKYSKDKYEDFRVSSSIKRVSASVALPPSDPEHDSEDEKNGRKSKKKDKKEKKCKKKMHKEKCREREVKSKKRSKRTSPEVCEVVELDDDHHTQANNHQAIVRTNDEVVCLYSSGEEEKRTEGEADGGTHEELYGPILPDKQTLNPDEGERTGSDGEEGEVEDSDDGATSAAEADDGSHGPNHPPVTAKDEKPPVAKEEERTAGPPLPVTQPPTQPRTYGPSLPTPTLYNSGALNGGCAEESYGPSLPPSTKSRREPSGGDPQCQEEDDDCVGPLPVGATLTPAQILLQHRANLLRLHMDNKVDKKEVKREEWMLELPDVKHAGLGLVARSFKTKVNDSKKDSGWTDTPIDKAKKAALAQMGVVEETNVKDDHKREVTAKRNKQMEKLAEKANKEKRRADKSLLLLHQEKINKKKKKEEKEERRPFSRDTDLNVNQLSNAQKKAIYKKAQNLNTRFSSGESKYL